jgi:hypothetical protein
MSTIDVSELERWARVYATAPARSADIMRVTLNDVGNAARTQVTRTLARQMGLPVGTVRQGLTTKPATLRSMDYEILSRGGYLSLRSFDAEQRRAGVSARPWGKRRIFGARSPFARSAAKCSAAPLALGFRSPSSGDRRCRKKWCAARSRPPLRQRSASACRRASPIISTA